MLSQETLSKRIYQQSHGSANLSPRLHPVKEKMQQLEYVYQASEELLPFLKVPLCNIKAKPTTNKLWKVCMGFLKPSFDFSL